MNSSNTHTSLDNFIMHKDALLNPLSQNRLQNTSKTAISHGLCQVQDREDPSECQIQQVTFPYRTYVYIYHF